MPTPHPYFDDGYHFIPARPLPTKPKVVAYIGSMPVVKATEIGVCPRNGILRETAFLVPGDDRLHRAVMVADAEYPRSHPAGCFVVLQVTTGTRKAVRTLRRLYAGRTLAATA